MTMTTSYTQTDCRQFDGQDGPEPRQSWLPVAVSSSFPRRRRRRRLGRFSSSQIADLTESRRHRLPRDNGNEWREKTCRQGSDAGPKGSGGHRLPLTNQPSHLYSIASLMSSASSVDVVVTRTTLLASRIDGAENAIVHHLTSSTRPFFPYTHT